MLMHDHVHSSIACSELHVRCCCGKIKLTVVLVAHAVTNLHLKRKQSTSQGTCILNNKHPGVDPGDPLLLKQRAATVAGAV